jgi:uncharacterized membrane protein
VACMALLLCVKMAGPRANDTPSRVSRVLAVRELLAGASSKAAALPVKTAKPQKMSAASSALASKQGKLISSAQKLDEAPAAEEAPAEEAAPAAEAAPAEPAAEAAPAVEEPAEEPADKVLGEPAAEELQPGWNKSAWSSGDWASWVITGPFITLCFSFFMFYTYGVPAGVLTAIICAFIDIATFYYNW